MGGAASNEASPGGPEGAGSSSANEPSDPNGYSHYEAFFRGEVDAEAAFKEAFADDINAYDEIHRIVQELSGKHADPTSIAKETKRLQEMAAAQEQKERRAQKVVTQKAQQQADEWFNEQVRKGKAAESAALSAKKPASKVKSAGQASEEIGKANIVLKQQAVAEVAARAALLEKAAVVKQENNSLGTLARGIPVPVKPLEPEENQRPPSPPPKKNKQANNTPEFYKLLGVSVDATFDEIKKGYRKQAMLWHPDKNRQRLHVATEHFKKINAAFDVLYDPQRRSAYDSGQLQTQGKAKKLQGHGWSSLSDEDDAALTPLGIKYKKQSWRGYVLMYGRIDDDPDQLVQDDNDPRAPQEKIKIFWRMLGEMAFLERESGHDNWLQDFVLKVWKDTPSRWPKALELQTMNDAGQQEWKERRMVYNRRKQKLLLHIELHEEYLAIPNREKKEIERLQKTRPGWVSRISQGEGLSTDPMRST